MLRSAPYSPPFCPCACPISLHTLLVISAAAKATLDGFDQRDYLEGKSEKSASDCFFYYSGATPSAVRCKNWKMYYTKSQGGAAGWLLPLVPYQFTLVQNIKHDPFEQNVVPGDEKSALAIGGALAAPSNAYLYDWNILPIGQQLWLEELESYKEFPPLQAAETYNLDQIIHQVKAATTIGHPAE
jgi:C-terminal region of aryl-sulfatase